MLLFFFTPLSCCIKKQNYSEISPQEINRITFKILFGEKSATKMGVEMKLCVYLRLFFGRSPLPDGGGCMAGDT